MDLLYNSVIIIIPMFKYFITFFVFLYFFCDVKNILFTKYKGHSSKTE